MRIIEIMKFLEFQMRIPKIMKINEFQTKTKQNIENHVIPIGNHNKIMKIIKLQLIIQKIMKILDFQMRIMEIMKTIEFQLIIMKNNESHRIPHDKH